MTLFNKYRQEEGMTQKNANKLFEDAKLKINPDEIQHLFNLSQMTVLDELNNTNEYLEMDFVEYLELVVRIAFVYHKN